jgi:hypothetical protein
MPLSELSVAIAALLVGLVGGALAVRALKAGCRSDETPVAVRALSSGSTSSTPR